MGGRQSRTRVTFQEDDDKSSSKVGPRCFRTLAGSNHVTEFRQSREPYGVPLRQTRNNRTTCVLPVRFRLEISPVTHDIPDSSM